MFMFGSSRQEGSPSKRQRPNSSDPNKTPTAQDKLSNLMLASQDSQSERASSLSSISQRSGKSSPTKGIAALRDEKLVDYAAFSGPVRVPQDLSKVVRDVRRLAGAQGIVTSQDAEAFRNTTLDLGEFRDDLEYIPTLVDPSEARSNLGQLPSVDRLVEIWQEATYCERNALPEAHWNSAVHFPILNEALRNARCNNFEEHQTEQQFRVKPANISTINVAKRYIPLTSRHRHNKRIDFCIYLDVAQDSAFEEDIRSKVATSVHDSINHIEAPWLHRLPMCIGIETKKTGEDWHAALEQMTIWLSAHWKRLGELAVDLDSLPFLPGVIIQGHDWFFVAATQGRLLNSGGRQTVIWSKVPIGSTDGLGGICQIIAILQYLARWSAEFYYPWFHQAILGNDSTEPTSGFVTTG
ncbi:hypothetical protein NM208_g12634 [Fusarium decemcellulare]|uniref:Uncharacterized protein n=1 Tax=Fusarium decemcellulare TaxID=57161 RepID=A0ACC1RP43_9HYPO|nr:hypothetical protein NM208_g12634 [Fusarium decemcellulare]